VRFFGGDLSRVACGTPTFVRDAYASGTPMGGEMGAIRGARSPRFAVWAVKDPGTATSPGTDLQRIQIVKGWVDRQGKTHEQVSDVAGDAQNGADVDPATCGPRGAGARDLCAIWTDPTFKRGERAFYYARVLENPTCRWSTRLCKEAGVDPFSPNCAAAAATAGAVFANCCVDHTTDPFLDTVVQERAWTSPIWYRPDGIARLHAHVRYGTQPGTDRLAVDLTLGGVPKGLNPRKTDLEIRVTDDDDILRLTIPAGTLRRSGRGSFLLPRRIGPVNHLSLLLRGRTARLVVATAPTDLSHADRTDHMVTVSLAAGTYRVEQTRLWVVHEGRLVPGGR